jgi:hypothetical protein
MLRTNRDGDDVVIVAIARPAELVVAQAVLKKNTTEISVISERPIGDFHASQLLVTAEDVRSARRRHPAARKPPCCQDNAVVIGLLASADNRSALFCCVCEVSMSVEGEVRTLVRNVGDTEDETPKARRCPSAASSG